MTRRGKLAVAAVIVTAAGAASGGIAIAAGGDDRPLGGATLERAKAAALAHTGGGTVTETEAGDDGAAYEVEVRLAGGRQVEVRLDERFRVTGEAADDDEDGADGD